MNSLILTQKTRWCLLCRDNSVASCQGVCYPRNSFTSKDLRVKKRVKRCYRGNNNWGRLSPCWQRSYAQGSKVATKCGFRPRRNIGNACSRMREEQLFCCYLCYLYSIGTLAYHRLHLKVTFGLLPRWDRLLFFHKSLSTKEL